MAEPVILYVEDEPNDVALLQLGFKRAGLPCHFQVVDDGEQAIAYLTGQGQYADRSRHPLPTLVLLDLNLPRMTGFEVLEWVRRQPQFASLPILIYTSSERQADQERTRELGATGYVVKPSSVLQLAEFARNLTGQWLAGGG